MYAYALFLCIVATVSAQWGAEKSPPSCSCGNHFELHGTMDGFDSEPLMAQYRELNQLSPEEALSELEDDRVCSKCARAMVKVEK